MHSPELNKNEDVLTYTHSDPSLVSIVNHFGVLQQVSARFTWSSKSVLPNDFTFRSVTTSHMATLFEDKRGIPM
jgi:hypothetical protein